MIKEYRERKIKIKNLEKKLEDLNLNAQTKEQEIERLHCEWLQKIQELTVLLSTNFQKFLTSFGCSGIIELDIGVTRVNILYLLLFFLTIIIIYDLNRFNLKCWFIVRFSSIWAFDKGAISQ